MIKLYRYLGPADIKARVFGSAAGTRISSSADLLMWVRSSNQRPGTDGLVAATFAIDTVGDFLVADRRSEHVACAGGGPVLSAGEVFFLVESGRVEVAEITNLSTGYCPEPGSWGAVAAALSRAGVAHPGEFTTEVVFRRCEHCGERNVVRDAWFICGVCGADLPGDWNF